MKNYLKISLLLLLITGIFSCKKDEATTTPTTTGKVNSMSAFNAVHKKPTQHITLNATTGGYITSTGGIQFYFPPNSLVNSAGSAVTGNVDVQVDEVISKADLILNQISTHCNGRPLKSGGAFKIKVTQGSEELSVATGKEYKAWLGSDYFEPAMESWYGFASNDQYGILNWTLTPPSFGPTVTANSTDTTMVYELLLKDFEWVNCDHPYDSVFAELNITLPTGCENAQITVMDNNSMNAINLWEDAGIATWHYAPLNKSLTIVVIMFKQNEYKFSVQTANFTGQQVVIPSLATISENDLEAMIQSLH